VSTATSVHGLAQGTIPVTATPNIANGTGGAAATGTTTTGGTPPPAAPKPPAGPAPLNIPVPGQGPGHDDAPHQDAGPPAPVPTAMQLFYELHHAIGHWG
jgi:hypothetical protein